MSQKSQKQCPWYKKMPGTTFAVDAFSFGAIPGITAYFLTHFHADHYGGLKSTFHGKIYCSRVTRNLVIQQLQVPAELIVEMPMEEPVIVEGVTVTLVDANHCPGAVLFHFQVPSTSTTTTNILHTGDFRASRIAHLENTIISSLVGKLDILYLDTTYCQPHHVFPSQQSSIDDVRDLCLRIASNVSDSLKFLMDESKSRTQDLRDLEMKKSGQRKISDIFRLKNPEPTYIDLISDDSEVEDTTTKIVKLDMKACKTLFLVGTYLIGKEKVFMSIKNELNCRIYCNERKENIIRCQENVEISDYLTDDPLSTNLHVVSINDLNPAALEDYYNHYANKFTNLVAFKPTGWAFTNKGSKELNASSSLKLSYMSKDYKIACFSVPYSEHSSYAELEMFTVAMRAKRIVPTVNVHSDKSREAMDALIKDWQSQY